MVEREIKITFPEVKMEALEFFLRENGITAENVLEEHLEKTYEKSVPQQVRKFVESKMAPQMETVVQTEGGSQRQPRGQGRRNSRQNAAREAVLEQESAGGQVPETMEVQDAEPEQDRGMVFGM